jgi:hypothetical protein
LRCRQEGASTPSLRRWPMASTAKFSGEQWPELQYIGATMLLASVVRIRFEGEHSIAAIERFWTLQRVHSRRKR